MIDNYLLDVFDPSNGKKISSIAIDSKQSGLDKIERAHAYFSDSKNRLPLYKRIELLEKLTAALVSKRTEITTIMIQEGGKPYADSLVEVDRAIEGIKIAIKTISDHKVHVIPLRSKPNVTRSATTQKFPRGVVLAFSAFNHPLNLIIHQVIPAFASNCPCVIKPAPDTPLSCLKLVEIMLSVGIPEPLIQVVITQDVDVAGAMVESEKISFFSFIGSAKIGWMLRSRLKPGVRCALEHGGVAPAIVTQCANLSTAVESIAKGGLYHAGQVCVSTQRVYIDESVFFEFVDSLVAYVAQLNVGNASDSRTDIGPLIRDNEIKRIHSWVQEAVSIGATCAIGGRVINSNSGGNFYAPTILINPSPVAKVSRKEIFGPVICVYSYNKFEDALDQANHSDVAFHAAIYSDNINEIYRAYEVLETSALMVNDHTAFRDDAMPFSGLKQSGLGIGGIPYTIEDMQYEKMLMLKK